MSELNIELLKQVRDKIASAPKAYDQATFGSASKTAPCETAACIAGWACVLGGAFSAEEIRAANRSRFLMDAIPSRAASLLGLDKGEADTLFTGEPEGAKGEWDDDEREGGWPEPFATQWEEANTQREVVAVAVAYLNHIIETGTVE